MARKKISKKTKKNKVKPKSIEPKNNTSVISHIYSIVCICLGIFVFIFQYFETQKGVLGYFLEVTSLYAFGNLGFFLIPFLLTFCGVISLFSKYNTNIPKHMQTIL